MNLMEKMKKNQKFGGREKKLVDLPASPRFGEI